MSALTPKSSSAAPDAPQSLSIAAVHVATDLLPLHGSKRWSGPGQLPGKLGSPSSPSEELGHRAATFPQTGWNPAN